MSMQVLPGYLMPLPNILRRKREDKGLTRRELSDLSGVTEGHISKIEEGRTKQPGFQTVRKLLKALDSSLSELEEELESEENE